MDFYRKMRIVCLAIPEGSVASYGQIALLCGAPNHSRHVGHGLKHNLAGDDIPAHRVVNSRGELSGAIHFEMPDLQKYLLESEGVEVKWNGKIWCVDLKKYGWRNTQTDAAAFQKQFEA
ncbi:MAG: MGMT family protein [Clostridia bacterium]|nr:MGMT family protein [Clostridia bacterium]